jgi:hypothetical protein
VGGRGELNSTFLTSIKIGPQDGILEWNFYSRCLDINLSLHGLEFFFCCPSWHSFYLFLYFSVYSIDTIFILGDGLICLLLRWYLLLLRWYLLLLRWEKSALIAFCSWIFLG